MLFTDLKSSTQLYREIGDATAFGRVMNHFDVVKKLIAEEDGALVKTIGDAVMAVFRRPGVGAEGNVVSAGNARLAAGGRCATDFESRDSQWTVHRCYSKRPA